MHYIMLTIKSLASICHHTIGPLYPFYLPSPLPSASRGLPAQPSEALLTDSSCLRSSSLSHLCPFFYTETDTQTDIYTWKHMDKHTNAEIHTDTQHTQTNSQNTTHTDIPAHRHTQKHTQTPQTHTLLTHCFNEKAYILNLDLQGFKTGLTQCLPHPTHILSSPSRWVIFDPELVHLPRPSFSFVQNRENNSNWPLTMTQGGP